MLTGRSLFTVKGKQAFSDVIFPTAVQQLTRSQLT